MGKLIDKARVLSTTKDAELRSLQNELICDIVKAIDPDSPEPILKSGTKLYRPVVSLNTDKYSFGDEIIKQQFYSGDTGYIYGKDKIFETLFDADENKLYQWFEEMFENKSLSDNEFMIVPVLRITFSGVTKVCNINLAGIRLFEDKNGDKGVFLQYTGFLNEQKITFTNKIRIFSLRPAGYSQWEEWELTIIKVSVGNSIVCNNIFYYGGVDLLSPDEKQTVEIWNKLQELNNIEIFNGISFSDKWNCWFQKKVTTVGDQRLRVVFSFPSNGTNAVTNFWSPIKGHTHTIAIDYYLANGNKFKQADVYSIIDDVVQQANSYTFNIDNRDGQLQMNKVWTSAVLKS